MDLRQKMILEYALCFLVANLGDEQEDVEAMHDDESAYDEHDKLILSITEKELQQMINELQVSIEEEQQLGANNG